MTYASKILKAALAAVVSLALLVATPAWADSTTIGLDAASAFRDYTVPGNPASGAWQPSKTDIRNVFAEVQTAINALRGAVGISLIDYGADPTFSYDSASAFQAWWTACKAVQAGAYGGAGGHLCPMPAGHFKLLSSLYWDFAGNIGGGLKVTGGGQNATVLDFTAAPGTHLTIGCSSGTTSAECSVFYPVFDNFGVVANNASGVGGAVQVGQHASTYSSFTDAMNGFGFYNIWVKNVAGVVNSAGLELNQIYSSVFMNVTTSGGCSSLSGGDCSGAGDSLVLRQAAFNTFQGSFSGGRCGIHFVMGYSFGNTFLSPDLEVNHYDLCVDSASAGFNTINNGQWVWDATGAAVAASAGQSNVVDNPNFSGSVPNTPGGATQPNPVVAGAAVGINVRGGPATLNIAYPTYASGAVVQNQNGRNQTVVAYNLALAATVCISYSVINTANPGRCISNNVAGASLSVPLNVGWYIQVTSSGGGMGSWTWNEML